MCVAGTQQTAGPSECSDKEDASECVNMIELRKKIHAKKETSLSHSCGQVLVPTVHSP